MAGKTGFAKTLSPLGIGLGAELPLRRYSRRAHFVVQGHYRNPPRAPGALPRDLPPIGQAYFLARGYR